MYFYILIKGNEDIINTCYLGTLPYLYDIFKRLSIKFTKNTRKEVIKNSIDGRLQISVRKYIYNTNYLDLYKTIKNTFILYKNPLDRILGVDLSEKGQTIKCIVTINFDPIETGFWAREKKIDIIIKYDEKKIELLNRLNDLQFNQRLVETIPILEELNEPKFIEDLAFAYCLNMDYPKSLSSSEEAININPRSIAHFTKGLVLVLIGQEDEAYKEYMHGALLVKPEIWYPKAKNNLVEHIELQNIRVSPKIQKILDDLENMAKLVGNRNKAKCFCGSKKPYYRCCGRIYID